MRPNGGGYDELTDPQNENVNATLTYRAWRKLAVKYARTKFLNLVYSPDELRKWLSEGGSPAELLLHQALQTSGAIHGEHRRDLKEAIIGAPVQGAALSVPVQAPQQQAEAPKKRGL